jgi:protein O-GlcNAc transferase
VLGRLGRYDAAVAAYERALALTPNLQAARINLGLAHFRAGAIAKAIATFNEALARDPSSIQARSLLGLALVEAGRHDEAIPHLEAASARMPDDAAILFGLGRAYASAGRPVDAIATRLAALPAGRPLWQHLQALQLQREGRHRDALAAFEAARTAGAGQPALPGLALAIGISRLALGEDAPAWEAFAQAQAQAPRDAVPVFYLAWIDERAGALPSARRLVEQALALDPDFGEAHALLGKILLAQGDAPGAVRHLAAASSHDPEDASIRYLLAQAYQRAGDPAAAARAFAESRQLKAREVARERQP